MATGTRTRDEPTSSKRTTSHGNPGRTTNRMRAPLRARLRRDKVLLLMVLPGLAYFLLFDWVPLAGNILAFLDYRPYAGLIDSVWVGLENFTTVFAEPAFWSAFRNTMIIAVVQLVLFFPIPIMLALLLNSIISKRVRTLIQSVVYLPHFIGWVTVVAIFTQVLGASGVVPHALNALGLPEFDAMTAPHFFPFLLTIQLVWKDAGWGTIIFLAALMNISQELYESAAADGAGPFKRMRHITLPGMAPVIILLLILNLGNILTVGFEQILLQRDNVGPEAGEVLDTYVYFHGIQDGEWGTSAAVGLIKGVVALILVLAANKVAHLFGQEGIYSRGS